jgi:FKBP-type peptidyl-prolyl cis-trans isomerase FkpA
MELEAEKLELEGGSRRMRSSRICVRAAGAIVVVIIWGSHVNALKAHVDGTVPAQAPQKARKTPRPGTATVLGVIEVQSGENSSTSDAIVFISVRNGENLRRIAISVEGASEVPQTVASHYGEPLAGSALRLALAEPGCSVKVTYVVEPRSGTDAHLATAIEIGDAPKKGSPAPGLKYEDMVVGLGTIAQRGDGLRVHYTGWLKGGEQFDSSHERGAPMEFILGTGKVIRGWELGIAGMREGGKRRLTIGPGLAYGVHGSGSRIPPNATLIFEVELLQVN